MCVARWSRIAVSLWLTVRGRSVPSVSRSRIPTIPSLPVTQQVRALLQQPALSQIARSAGGPAIDPNAPVSSGQFPQTPTSGGTVAQAPTSQQTPAASTPPSSESFVSQIVQQAVNAVLNQPTASASEGTGGGGGPAGGGGGGTGGGGQGGVGGGDLPGGNWG